MQLEKSQLLDNSLDRVQRNVVWLVLGIIFIASNLRTPITAMSPLVDLIKHDMPLSNTLVALLTMLPLFAFAALSPFVPQLARRFGIEHTVFAALLIMLVGSLVREIGNESGLLLGTLLTGLGIAIGNVILPAIIKKQFPLRIGIMTGIYSISMNIFAATGSAISVPLANSTRLGWRGTLFTISFFGLLSLLIWIPQLKYNQRTVQVANQIDKARFSVWRSRMAWQITLAMGLQSFIFYTFVAWLPKMLVDQGMSHEQSGFMLSLIQAGTIPTTFIIPIVAVRMKSQFSLLIGSFALFLIGFTGLMVTDGNVAITSISAVFIGIASGTAFSLSMVFFSLRTRNAREASEISGMAQSIGYLVAATGPFLFGSIHDVTHHWTIPMMLLITAAILFALLSVTPASGKKYIFPE